MVYILTEYDHRFGKHRLKAGIATEVEVNLLGNVSLVPLAKKITQKNRGTAWVGDLYSGRLEVIIES